MTNVLGFNFEKQMEKYKRGESNNISLENIIILNLAHNIRKNPKLYGSNDNYTEVNNEKEFIKVKNEELLYGN